MVYGKKKMQIVPPNKQYEGYIVWYVMYHIIYKKKFYITLKRYTICNIERYITIQIWNITYATYYGI